mmetsp:Transcript_34972/g.100727  ORF Transcript_34972/g.100727 Transcript_34972/m.100727 type:complete len:119 (+) Transcript_34972:131-487(+)
MCVMPDHQRVMSVDPFMNVCRLAVHNLMTSKAVASLYLLVRHIVDRLGRPLTRSGPGRRGAGAASQVGARRHAHRVAAHLLKLVLYCTGSLECTAKRRFLIKRLAHGDSQDACRFRRM